MKRDRKTLICMTDLELGFLNDLVSTYSMPGMKITKSDLVRFAIHQLPLVPVPDFFPLASKVRASNTAL
jgi:hypothetical protein